MSLLSGLANLFNDAGVFLDLPTHEVQKVRKDRVVARLSVRSGEEWRLLGDAEAELALLLVVLLTLQVLKFHHLQLSNHVLQTSAIADVEPAKAAGAFQLGQGEFGNSTPPVLFARASGWSARTDANRVGLPIFGLGNAGTMKSCEGKRQGNPRGWSRSVV